MASIICNSDVLHISVQEYKDKDLNLEKNLVLM